MQCGATKRFCRPILTASLPCWTRGSALIAVEEYKEAEKCIDVVLGRDPNNVAAMQRKGVILKGMGQYDDAMRYFERVIGPIPIMLTRRLTWARFSLRCIARRRALPYLERALELAPESVNSHCNKGVALEASWQLAPKKTCAGACGRTFRCRHCSRPR